MAVAPAQVRAPDIILRQSIPHSTTSDAPVADAAQPPVSASNDPADLQSGVAKEITAQELAAATAARKGAPPDTDPKADPKPAALEATDDPLPGDESIDSDEVDPGIGTSARRRILEERRRGREYRATLEALVKAKIGDENWDNAVKQSRDKLVQAERERADKAGREARKAQEELDAARAELAAVPKKVDEPAEDARPSRDGFDDPDLYDQALEAWGIREGERKVAAREAEAKAAQEAADKEKGEIETREARDKELAALHLDWQTAREAAIEKYPDYEAVAEASTEDGGPVISDAMAASILQTENGTDIAYYLGKNPDEAERIAKIPNPIKQAMEMGKLAERLGNPPRRARPANPITPIDGGDNRVTDTAAEPDMNSYFAKRSAELQRQRRPFYPPGDLH